MNDNSWTVTQYRSNDGKLSQVAESKFSSRAEAQANIPRKNLRVAKDSDNRNYAVTV